MKKIIYLAGICLAATLASCEDFLSVESPDKIGSDNYWINQANAEAGLAAAYSQLYHGDTYATSEVRWPVEEYRADLFNLGEDATNYSEWVALNNFGYTNGNSMFSYYYQDLYRGINFANQVLANVASISSDAITDEARKNITNEAHFLRGYYHMMLLLNWDKIVVRDVYESDPAKQNKALSPRPDCWKFIIDELQKATALPATRSSEELGRATSGAANAYLGFAYLTRAYEETEQKDKFLEEAWKALVAVNNDINGTTYDLVSGDDYINMFNGNNKNCKESIFEIQYTKSEASGSVHYSFVNQWIGAKELGGYDEILPSKVLVEAFKKEKKADGSFDARMYATMYFRDPFYNNGKGNILGCFDYDQLFCDYDLVRNETTNQTDTIRKPETLRQDEYVFRKFTSATYEEMSQSCAINIPLMRYANVLLMQAEVLNEQGHSDRAIPYLNKVRNVHGGVEGLPANSDYSAVKADIEHQRILEFPLESYRWYDMRRWGVTAERLQAADRTGFNESKLFYPIPQWEIDANPLVKE